MTILCSEKTVNGELFRRMIRGGAACLHENVQIVNDLNVFPIPDGDTGENMYLTMKGGVDALNGAPEELGDMAKAVATGMLLGARGNSGVILSQLIFGLSEGLKGCSEADPKTLSDALLMGVKCAYGAVANPTEGTVLTVAREAAERAAASAREGCGIAEMFEAYLEEMRASLERTPELLPVLMEAGVIDSGGAGLLYITEGFARALSGESFDADGETAVGSAQSLDLDKFDSSSEMVFGYCTEILLRLQNSKCDPESFSVEELIAFLETVGDSIVAFKTGTAVKIHVHTMKPYLVLEHCQRFGEYLTVKIENMTLQHNESVTEREKLSSELLKMPKRQRRPFATVTVGSGEGVINMLTEMGADYVISGGQTQNPSAEDFTRAFDQVNADVVFVLPNNKNILLAAKQAAEIYGDSDIRVIETRSLGEGYSALEMLDYSSNDADAIEAQMREDMKNSLTGMIARSVRDTSVGGIEIERGDYMGFTDRDMLLSTKDKLDAARELAKRLADGRDFLIAVYGKDMTEAERASFREWGEGLSGVEFYEINGEMEVYDLILIAE